MRLRGTKVGIISTSVYRGVPCSPRLSSIEVFLSDLLHHLSDIQSCESSSLLLLQLPHPPMRRRSKASTLSRSRRATFWPQAQENNSTAQEPEGEHKDSFQALLLSFFQLSNDDFSTFSPPFCQKLGGFGGKTCMLFRKRVYVFGREAASLLPQTEVFSLENKATFQTKAKRTPIQALLFTKISNPSLFKKPSKKPPIPHTSLKGICRRSEPLPLVLDTKLHLQGDRRSFLGGF